jgi:AmmeMemoRadiSam system protein B/AmmeMemoRadiSam system protein A
VTRVVLIGPAHHVPVAGLALPEASRFLTPLGEVPVDLPLAARVLRLPQVTRSAAAHALEHSLEVQLPFLQALLDDFAILPLAVGRASSEDVAEVLREAWGGEETLLVISTDLSHYLAQDEARALDERTARAILALDAEAIGPEQACGQHGLAGLLVEARRRGLGCTLLDLRSSGDTAGDPEAVVGYGAFALGAEGRGTDVREASGRAADAAHGHSHRGRILTGLARAAIASRFGHAAPPRPAGEPWLDEHRACFVSLHRRGALRGCIGATAPRASLFEELVHCARAAAEDPRFEPVSEPELPGLALEVSVLSPLEPVPVSGPGEAEALAALRPGVDGLLLEAEGRRAIFIPAMWEELPDPAEFVGHLRRKAGLPPGWSPGTRLQRFTAERYQEEGAP